MFLIGKQFRNTRKYWERQLDLVFCTEKQDRMAHAVFFPHLWEKNRFVFHHWNFAVIELFQSKICEELLNKEGINIVSLSA